MKFRFSLFALIILGLAVATTFQACGKKSGFGVGGKVIVSGSGG
jgi:hypothetical protein